MLKLNYVSQEVYTFERDEELIIVLSLDEFQPGKFDPPSKSITYQINHNRCIRLRDLIFWIESNFVRIHLGQLLQLILSILQKVEFIENKGLEHNFLDFNRIWLRLEQNSQYPNLIYSFLYYTIHFTGYQCPLNDESLNSQKASIRIKQIIKIIIDKCFLKIQLNEKNQEFRNQVYQIILLPIIKLCESNSLINIIIEYIQQILNHQKYQDDNMNKFVQSLDVDDNINDYIGSERYKVIEKVNQDLSNIIKFGNQHGQLIIEYLLQYMIPIIAQNLKSYSLTKSNFQNKAFDEVQNIKNRQLEIQQRAEQQIKNLINYYLEEYSKDYKFDINELEIKQIQQETLDFIFQSPHVGHFYNTYWFQKNTEINNFIHAASINLILQEIKEKLEILFLYKILQMINDLISIINILTISILFAQNFFLLLFFILYVISKFR